MASSPRSLLAIGLAILVTPALAQRSGGTGSTGGTGSRGGNTGSLGSTGTSTGGFPQPGNNRPSLSTQQILYISGTVVMQDGTPPPEPVAIEKVCGASAHKEGYTDSKGRYQIQLGQNFELQDVSESGSGSMLGRGGSSLPGGPNQGISTRDLLGCEIRALLPGFQSSTAMLRAEGEFGEIRMDTIILKRLGGGGTGSTISLTSMQAPNGARKAYEKAQKDADKNDLKNAEKELTKAVTQYPKYAAAWAMLGMVHQGSNQFDQAAKDYQQAINADPQYVKPYFGLAVLAVNQHNWNDALRMTDQVTRLDPLAYPEAYFFGGVASFNLNKLDDAERDMRKFISLDNEHRRPIAALYLGEILNRKQDYAGAVQQAKAYLALAPNAPNADDVREKVKKMEQMTATTAERQQN